MEAGRFVCDFTIARRRCSALTVRQAHSEPDTRDSYIHPFGLPRAWPIDTELLLGMSAGLCLYTRALDLGDIQNDLF
jgi:hypothetical protein